MKVNIGGYPNIKIDHDTINIEDSINERSTASFTVYDNEAKHHFEQGTPVNIYDYSNEINLINRYRIPYDTLLKISYMKGRTIQNLLGSNGLGNSLSGWGNNVASFSIVDGCIFRQTTSTTFTSIFIDVPVVQNAYYFVAVNNVQFVGTAGGFRFNFGQSLSQLNYGAIQGAGRRGRKIHATLGTTLRTLIYTEGNITIKTKEICIYRITAEEFALSESQLLERYPYVNGTESAQATVITDKTNTINKTLRSNGNTADEIINETYIKRIADNGSILAIPIIESVPSFLVPVKANQLITLTTVNPEVKAYIDYVLYYNGYIHSSKERVLLGSKAPNGKRQVKHYINCKDMTYLADKRLIAKSYLNMYCGDIVRDIITNYLGVEGVTIGKIEQGELMEEVAFNYTNIHKALDRLAESSNFIQFIDFDKKLYFMSRESDRNTNPLTSKDIQNPSLELGNHDYRNKQFIKGGKDLTDTMIESFRGDGENRNFTVAFPIGEKPQIMVNYVLINPNDVGIRGVDPTTDEKDEQGNVIAKAKKWFWSKESNVVNQNDNEPVVPFGTNIRVQYRGLFDIVISLPDTAEIEKHQQLEKNSGIIEKISEETDNNSILMAIHSASSKLKKYATEAKTLETRTRRTDLKAGQMIRVNLPEFDLNEDMLIQQVRISEESSIVWHEVILITGPEAVSFYKMFDKVNESKSRIIRENIEEKEIIPIPVYINKTWTQAEPTNIFRELYPSPTLYPNANLFPTFAEDDRIKFMDVLSGSNVIVRLAPIKQVKEPNRIRSIFYIRNEMANTNITSLRFIGGHLATNELNTGIIIHTHTYNKSKTPLEILIIDRLDTKGW